MFWVGMIRERRCKGLWMLLREAEATRKIYRWFCAKQNQLYFIMVRFAWGKSNHKFSTSFRTFRKEPEKILVCFAFFDVNHQLRKKVFGTSKNTKETNGFSLSRIWELEIFLFVRLVRFVFVVILNTDSTDHTDSFLSSNQHVKFFLVYGVQREAVYKGMRVSKG